MGEGPVSGISMHPHQDDASLHGVDATFDLALTCSFDWSIKLWMVKQYQHPVLSLDVYEDYVYDAKWHPAHPAVFASVDGEGHVDLWNLNRCHWSVDGRRLATGDSDGAISIYTVDRTVVQPRNEDYQQFQERVRHFQPLVQPILSRSRDPNMF